jgi:hypothetical protein
MRPKITEITVTPDNVDEHLEKCKSNRNRSRKHINTWKRAIKKGHFRDGGLIFCDEKGRYDDGQHRLWAVKETGHKAIFYVVSGMTREMLDMMVDAGKKRSNQDRLKALPGIKYATLVCPAIEIIIDLQEDWKRTTLMLLPDEVLHFYHEHRKELTALAEAYAGFADISPKLLLALQFVFTRINETKSDEFFAGVKNRHLLQPGQPLYAFYEMIGSAEVVNAKSDATRARYIKNGLLIAWRSHVKGETLDKIVPNERYITIEGTAAAPVENNNADDTSASEPDHDHDQEDESGETTE